MAAYRRILAGRPVRSVCEIGVGHGASLRMWADIFPHAEIVGIDIAPEYWFSEPRITVIIGDATYPETAYSAAEFAPFDLIVDDGSHDPRDVRATFANLSDFLKPNGLYVVEDVDWPMYPGRFYPGTGPTGAGIVVAQAT